MNSNENNSKSSNDSLWEAQAVKGDNLKEARPALLDLVGGQFQTLEAATLEVAPDDPEQFQALAYKRQALFDLIAEIDNIILMGEEARERLQGEFKDEPDSAL